MAELKGPVRDSQEDFGETLFDLTAQGAAGTAKPCDLQVDLEFGSGHRAPENRAPSESRGTPADELQYSPPTEALRRAARLHDLEALSVLRSTIRSVQEFLHSEIDEVVFTPGRLLFFSGEPVHVVRRDGQPVAFFRKDGEIPARGEITKAQRWAETQPVYARERPKFTEINGVYRDIVEEAQIGHIVREMDTSVILRDGRICSVLHEGVPQPLFDSRGMVTAAYAEGWLIARQFKGFDAAESDLLLQSTAPDELDRLFISSLGPADLDDAGSKKIFNF